MSVKVLLSTGQLMFLENAVGKVHACFRAYTSGTIQMPCLIMQGVVDCAAADVIDRSLMYYLDAYPFPHGNLKTISVTL